MQLCQGAFEQGKDALEGARDEVVQLGVALWVQVVDVGFNGDVSILCDSELRRQPRVTQRTILRRGFTPAMVPANLHFKGGLAHLTNWNSAALGKGTTVVQDAASCRDCSKTAPTAAWSSFRSS